MNTARILSIAAVAAFAPVGAQAAQTAGDLYGTDFEAGFTASRTRAEVVAEAVQAAPNFRKFLCGSCRRTARHRADARRSARRSPRRDSRPRNRYWQLQLITGRLRACRWACTQPISSPHGANPAGFVLGAISDVSDAVPSALPAPRRPAPTPQTLCRPTARS
ncbi:MAG: DUF4148 domain-containing protein [Simplicispira sp.]|nr:DUF4148 domain-containing protein [Simplicispira sp.]